MEKIFVQIASYRDPELVKTITDCIEKAKYPENLTFGVCWQYGADEVGVEDFLKNVPNLKYEKVEHFKSRGLCWARSIIQKMWDGEEYTLQLDSHHRFAQDWDSELLDMMEKTGSEKPIIGSYAGMYDPDENKLLNTDPYKMVADRFTDSGTIIFRPHSIPGYEKLDAPIPARFVSGHYFFTIGKHCEEYRYDPNIYFAGDEISLSIRSYTLGYDLFHPHKTVVWHEYTRKNRVKHWDDFNEKNKNEGSIDSTWSEIDQAGKKRLRQMLGEEDNGLDLGEYGLGTVRSHRDYEIYSGINFREKRLHPDTKDGKNPPVNDMSDWWTVPVRKYQFDIEIPKFASFEFIYVGVEDDIGNVVFRKDIREYCSSVTADFESSREPFKTVVWQYTKNGWGERMDKEI